MSKKKSFLSPSQMILLTGTTINDGQTGGGLQMARPDAFEDGEEEIILPDGETVSTDGEDILIPGVTSADPLEVSWDEAYY